MGLRDLISKVSDRARRGGGREIPLTPALMAQTPAPNPPGDQVDGWFGPLTPQDPSAPPSVAGRRMDYPSGINMIQQPRPYEAVGYGELRALADGYDLLRLAIETRKDQLARLTWNFQPRDPKAKIEGELGTRAKKYEDLFRRPDRENFWGTWIRNVLEDLLVIDAPAIHVRRTLGGDIYSLDQIDGATIKRVIDDGGRTPEPPFCAYQQVLKGMPAVNYSKNDLIYKPRNLRVQKLYGYSPVEQIIMTVNLGLRRQLWQLAYFTHGNIPDSLIGVPATWTPDQIRQFQDWFDSLLQGNMQDRRSARFVPGEVAKSYVPTKDAEIFGAAEEWLARVVCFCFGISHQALVKEVNRATAQTAQESAAEDGLVPIMNWIKELVDSVLIDQFGETELEFSWLDEKELDPKVQSEIQKTQLEGRVATINEIREELGKDPDPSPVANMLGTFTADGTFVPIDPAMALKFKQEAVAAFQALGLGPDGKAVPVEPELDADGNKIPADNDDDKSAGSEGRAAPKEGEEPGSARAAKSGSALVEKFAAKVPAVSPLRPKARRIRKSLQRHVAEVLQDVGDDVAAQAEKYLNARGVRKADVDLSALSDEEIDAMLAGLMSQLDLGGLDDMIDATRDDLERIARDTGRVALAQVGVEDAEELFDQVNENAVRYATNRAAELVGRRILEDGTIIDNPSPRWAITQTTRDLVRDTIAGGLRENIGSDQIIDALQESYAFSPARAEMISRTEIAMANSEAAMDSYNLATGIGVQMRKEWILGPNPCDVCIENSAAGAIELGQSFPSGHDNTPAHPNCECAVIAIVEED